MKGFIHFNPIFNSLPLCLFPLFQILVYHTQPPEHVRYLRRLFSQSLYAHATHLCLVSVKLPFQLRPLVLELKWVPARRSSLACKRSHFGNLLPSGVCMSPEKIGCSGTISKGYGG